MKKIEVNNRDKGLLDDMIGHWSDDGLLTPEQTEQLLETYQNKGFDWKRLAQYSFWVALSCVAFAFLSLLVEKEVRALLERFYETPDAAISILCLVLAVLFYVWGWRQKKWQPTRRFSNEAWMMLGVLATAIGLGYASQWVEKESGHYSLLFFVAVVLYGFLGIKLQSKLIWFCCLLSLGLWFAMETASHSDWGWRFWGMNYPMRFTIFGALLSLFAYFIQPKLKSLQGVQGLTLATGLSYLLVALWLVSVFGNYSDWDLWLEVRQYQLFLWGLLSLGVSAGFAYLGLKRKDPMFREFGIVFFMLNLYSRFFEYLWDTLNRTIFFALLALSFWLIGRWAEKLWNRSPPVTIDKK